MLLGAEASARRNDGGVSTLSERRGKGLRRHHNRPDTAQIIERLLEQSPEKWKRTLQAANLDPAVPLMSEAEVRANAQTGSKYWMDQHIKLDRVAREVEQEVRKRKTKRPSIPVDKEWRMWRAAQETQEDLS